MKSNLTGIGLLLSERWSTDEGDICRHMEQIHVKLPNEHGINLLSIYEP